MLSPLSTINRNQKKWNDSPRSESHFQILVHRSLLRGVPGTSPWWVLSLPLLGGRRAHWAIQVHLLTHSSGLLAVSPMILVDPPSLSSPPPSERGEFRGLKELLVPVRKPHAWC